MLCRAKLSISVTSAEWEIPRYTLKETPRRFALSE